MCSAQNGTRDCFADFYRLDADEMRLEKLVLPVLKQSGRPRPLLASSGLPLLMFQQSGRPLPTLERSGRILRSHQSRS